MIIPLSRSQYRAHSRVLFFVDLALCQHLSVPGAYLYLFRFSFYTKLKYLITAVIRGAELRLPFFLSMTQFKKVIQWSLPDLQSGLTCSSPNRCLTIIVLSGLFWFLVPELASEVAHLMTLSRSSRIQAVSHLKKSLFLNVGIFHFKLLLVAE